MTEQEKTDGPSVGAALSAAQTSLLVAIQFLENELKALTSGQEPMSGETEKAVKAVNASLRLFLSERDKLEDLQGKYTGRSVEGELDLAGAWREIHGRMARLRTEGEEEGILGRDE